MLGSILAAIGGSTVTGLFNQYSANKQMDFQSKMSNTSYQRAMADMKKAGLNPILAAKVGGASTPSGAMATMPDLGSTINSAMTVSNQEKQIESNVLLQESQKDLNYVQLEFQKGQTDINSAKATIGRLVNTIATQVEANQGSSVAGVPTASENIASALTYSLRQLGEDMNQNKKELYYALLANVIAKSPIADKLFDFFGGFGNMLKNFISKGKK